MAALLIAEEEAEQKQPHTSKPSSSSSKKARKHKRNQGKAKSPSDDDNKPDAGSANALHRADEDPGGNVASSSGTTAIIGRADAGDMIEYGMARDAAPLHSTSDRQQLEAPGGEEDVGRPTVFTRDDHSHSREAEAGTTGNISVQQLEAKSVECVAGAASPSGADEPATTTQAERRQQKERERKRKQRQRKRATVLVSLKEALALQV
jgi:hypothetical protein